MTENEYLLATRLYWALSAEMAARLCSLQIEDGDNSIYSNKIENPEDKTEEYKTKFNIEDDGEMLVQGRFNDLD